MTITLTNDQRAWLEAHVSRGDYGSIEEAVRQLLDERIAESELIENDDLAWAKPLVDEALAEVAAGQTISLDEHARRIDALLGAETRAKTR
ncbi:MULTISPECIES: ribbon-helix-helix domain-containing protein [Methylosinus]|uniref:Type II toxin-antitoxin system ParD family antitoxin n=1 Tax=Methylosinus sporium TaxID=428 RepID=A0A2U1SUK7_METSR|nr:MULTISPECIES: hypothetical protein [Methylosinus]PWB95303.1 hypothetical protein C5689_03965 [Methylosinus sporium]